MNVDPSKTPAAGGDGAPVQRTRSGQPTRAVSGPGVASRPSPPAGDDLVLSPQAQQFRKIRPRIESLTLGADARRLAELRTAINNGTYRIDTVRVAEAVLRDEIAGPLLQQDAE